MAFLEIASRIVDGVMIVDLTGELSRRASSFAHPLKDLLTQGRSNLVINLAGISYVGSSCLGQLITVWTSVGNRGGQLILLRPSGRVLEQLEMTKLDTVFTILVDEAQAIRRIQKVVSARMFPAT